MLQTAGESEIPITNSPASTNSRGKTNSILTKNQNQVTYKILWKFKERKSERLTKWAKAPRSIWDDRITVEKLRPRRPPGAERAEAAEISFIWASAAQGLLKCDSFPNHHSSCYLWLPFGIITYPRFLELLNESVRNTLYRYFHVFTSSYRKKKLFALVYFWYQFAHPIPNPLHLGGWGI